MLISKRLDTLITEESSEMKVDNSARICLKRQSFLNNFDSSSWTKCNNDNRSITKWGSKIVNLNYLSIKFLMKILAKNWRSSRKLRHSVWKSSKNVSFEFKHKMMHFWYNSSFWIFIMKISFCLFCELGKKLWIQMISKFKIFCDLCRFTNLFSYRIYSKTTRTRI